MLYDPSLNETMATRHTLLGFRLKDELNRSVGRGESRRGSPLTTATPSRKKKHRLGTLTVCGQTVICDGVAPVPSVATDAEAVDELSLIHI